MKFLKLAKQRYSVRAYKSASIEDDKLTQILEAARLAPTACNLQSFKFIVIHTRGREDDLRCIYSDPWFVQAPIVICACGIPSQNWLRQDGKNYNDVDVTIAMDHLILAAADLGLGTCWIGAFRSDEARRILKIPNNINPIAFTPLGYPDDQPSYRHKNRKPIDELVCYEHWHN
jgi:nitroreductase